MSSALIAYRQEVFNFLKTVTIKYEPLANAINQLLINQGHSVNLDDPASWKYYMNMAGEYHSTDEMMYIQSVDTQETIPFTKASLALHPRTKQVYVPGTVEYQALCAQYAHQADLVKSIVYPVSDLARAISADNLTLISYGFGFLEPYETEAVTDDIETFLDYISNRWYFPHFSYEVLYPWAFYGMLWSLLAECIFASRIKNLKTNAVHSFHIWEKLTSEGLGDYRDILNRQQSMFLYQNIEYIKDNRGKQSNLRLLTDNLLDPIAIGLVGKIVYQSPTPEVSDECRWVPRFDSERVPTRYADVLQQIPTQDMAEMNIKLFESGFEIDNTTAHVDNQEKEIGATTINTFPTKVLEIRPISIDRQYADILHMFILDNVMMMISRETYKPRVFVVDKPTGAEIRLSGKDALALYYYCVRRSMGDEPTLLPTKYTSWAAFRPDIDYDALPENFVYAGSRYNYRSLVNVDKFVEDTHFPPGVLTLTTDFTEMLGRQFLSRIRQIEMSRLTSDYIVLYALKRLDLFVSDRKQHTISLSSTPDYATWFAEKGLESLVSFYNLMEDSAEKYKDLSAAIMEEIVPINTDILRRYALDMTTKSFYERLRGLFTQLCSYHVLFVDTERDVEHWVRLPKTTIFTKELSIVTEQPIDTLVDYTPAVQVYSQTRYKGTDRMSFTTSVSCRTVTGTFTGPSFRGTTLSGEMFVEDTSRVFHRDTSVVGKTTTPYHPGVTSIMDPTAPV